MEVLPQHLKNSRISVKLAGVKPKIRNELFPNTILLMEGLDSSDSGIGGH
jgi:hypothetical protein